VKKTSRLSETIDWKRNCSRSRS